MTLNGDYGRARRKIEADVAAGKRERLRERILALLGEAERRLGKRKPTEDERVVMECYAELAGCLDHEEIPTEQIAWLFNNGMLRTSEEMDEFFVSERKRVYRESTKFFFDSACNEHLGRYKQATSCLIAGGILLLVNVLLLGHWIKDSSAYARLIKDGVLPFLAFFRTIPTFDWFEVLLGALGLGILNLVCVPAAYFLFGGVNLKLEADTHAEDIRIRNAAGLEPYVDTKLIGMGASYVAAMASWGSTILYVLENLV